MMKRETKRRIAYYQEALPDMKKKVGAAALMLMIAVIVSVTATYAWITLSVAPVVSSVNTTMSANGTLEIALSNPEGTEPEDMDIDESVTASSDVTVSNLRWGNLVNLSDSSYGIDNLVLRPAQLNTAALKSSPLWGAVYGADGRISTLDSNYTYAKWSGTQFVGAGNEFGVRAIASYTLGVSDETDAALGAVESVVTAAHNNVNTAYSQVSTKMSAMSPMITKYAQGKVDDTPSDNILFTALEIKSAHDLYVAVYDTMVAQQDAYVALANLQLYKNDSTLYTPLTWAEIVEKRANYNINDPSQTSKNGIVSLTGLNQFVTDLQTAQTDIATLKSYYEGLSDGSIASVSWTQLSGIVSHLIDQGTMTMILDGKEVALTSLSMDNAGSLLNSDLKTIYIYNGIVKRLEQLAVNETTRMRGAENGAYMEIKVKKVINITIKGVCFTKAADAPYFMRDYNKTKEVQIIGSDVVAEDSYGMAVDFWLRTNAEETYLTLEGAVAVDENNIIQSYDGVNRVWGSTGNAALTTNSTTQGGGSCYIYYADTPEDMIRSLELLRSMKVAFVDKNGKMMAQASMDTDNYYAVNGRITVPLALEETSGVSYTYIDETQAEQNGRAVTLMTHDESLWVTAIIYLDGAYLSNDHVLAAADIDGQLNIQFGSSVDLETVGDNELLTAERSVGADAYPKLLDWATAQQESELVTNVTVTVDGASPTSVTAFFVRAINSTQGERQGTMTFTKTSEEGNRWTASYQFDAPGVYYLRHVRLDGVDYALENPVMVEVKGFSISEVKWGEAEAQTVIYTPDSFYEATVSAKISSDDAGKMPKTVQARFLRDDGIMVNVDMRYDPSGKWIGEGTFYRSGTYALEYMLLDGEYYDISAQGYELTLYLGLNVAVHNDGSTTQDEYKAELAPYTKNVGVVISDNDGNILPIYEHDEEGNIKNDSSGNAKLLPWVSTARLRYSPGSSAANAVDSNLVWDETAGWFTAQLAITSPGRYAFYDVMIEGNSLTRATEAPVFTIMPPDPPRYQTSQSTALQFAPLTNDGFIGPIKISDSQTAALVAEVHNSVTDQTYLIPNQMALDTNIEEENGMSLSAANGLMTYDSGRESWFITPKYLSGEKETQEGIWSVKNFYVWNYMDESGTLVESDRRATWTESAYGLSSLTTEISCTLKVEMVPGNITLGDATTDFMTSHYVKDIGMKVLMKDGKDRLITGPILNKMAVSMTVSYSGNTGATYNAAYGYEVTAMNKGYSIDFVYDSTNQCWIVNETTSNHAWQYVGEYKVNSLTVSVGKEALSSEMMSNVPEKYIVVSAAPTADDLSIGTLTQGKTVFGKSGETVTGKFLDSYGGKDLGQIKLVLQYFDEETQSMQPATNAVIPITAELELTHLGGNEANGHYTWTGNNALSAFKINMSRNAATSEYTAATTPLLAGTYQMQAVITVGDSEPEYVSGKNISVYSMSPTVTMTAVNPSSEVTVNRDAGTEVSSNTFKATNAVVNDGKNAVVFMSYTPFTSSTNIATGSWGGSDTTYSGNFADYTEPKITFKLSGVSATCNSFALNIPGNAAAVSFSGNESSSEAPIGTITEGSQTYDGGFLQQAFTYKTETPKVIGEQTVGSINAVYDGTTYTVKLADEIIIVQKNEAAPSITYLKATDYATLQTPSAVVSEDGLAFEVTLPSSIGSVPVTYEQTDESVDWVTINNANEGLTYHTAGSGTSESYTSGCSTKFRGHCDFTFHLYNRNTLTREKTSTTTTMSANFGVTGWSIGGKTYAPGQTIEVTGTFVATPIIGRISEPIAVGTPTVKTLGEIIYTDTFVQDKTETVTVDNYDDGPSAAAAAEAGYRNVLPSGYVYGNNSNPKDDSWILLTPKVETYTK